MFYFANVPKARPYNGGKPQRLEAAHPRAMRVDVNRPPRPEALYGGGVEAGHTFACGFGVPGLIDTTKLGLRQEADLAVTPYTARCAGCR